jgi:predicted GNAT family acetyltransferase
LDNIKHHPSGKKGSFHYEVSGLKLAEIAYVMSDNHTMIIEHTEVDDSMRRKGIGKKLLAALVDYVREHKIQVVPLCPFANVTFQKTREWQDVLVNVKIKHKN